MSESRFFVESSYLATKNAPEKRNLACGKVEIAREAFIFYLIDLQNPFLGSKVVKKIIQAIREKALSEPPDAEGFEAILKYINDTLGKVSEVDDSWIGNLDAVIGLINQNEISISQSGNVIGYIFRGNKISTITEKKLAATPPHPLKTFSDIVAGDLVFEDQVIFGNAELFYHISLDRLRNLIQAGGVRQEALSLAKYLRKAKIVTANAVIIGPRLEGADREEEALLAETVLVDDLPDNLKIVINNYLIPGWELTKKYSIIIAKFIGRQSVKIARKSKKEWESNLGPKTKKFLTESNAKLKLALADSNPKKRPAITFNERQSFKKLKIRAVSYSKIDKKRAGQALEKAWHYLLSLRFLFKPKNRKYLYGFIIILIILFAYTKISGNNEKREEQIQQIQTINSYDKASELFTKTKEDLALGRTSNPERLYEALALAEQAESADANKERAKILALQIKNTLDKYINAVRFLQPASFSFGDSAKKIVLIGSEVYGINAEGKIYLADTRDQESKLVGAIGADAGTPVNLAYSETMKKLLILTDKNRVLAFDLTSKVINELKTENPDGLWEDGLSLKTYSTNVYLLDSEAGEVWKHTEKADIFSKSSAYADTKKATVRGAVDLAVDGNIYVLQNDGRVLKFVKGAFEQDFSVKNIPLPDNKILIPARIETNEDTNQIFILDKKANRIIKFDKSGDFVNQYIFDGVTIEDFLVNTKLQKIWALSEDKIYEGNL